MLGHICLLVTRHTIMNDASHPLQLIPMPNAFVHITILRHAGFVKFSIIVLFTSESIPLKNISTSRASITFGEIPGG